MKSTITIFCFLALCANCLAQEIPNVMIAIPPGQMELSRAGYGQPKDGTGLRVRNKPTLAGANVLIKYEAIDGEEKIAEFVETSLKIHLDLMNSLAEEIEVTKKSVGDAKKTDDDKFIVRDIVLEFKNGDVFKTKKLFARTVVRNDGASVAVNIQAQYEAELDALTKWSKKISIVN